MKEFDLDTAEGEKLASALETSLNEDNLAASFHAILTYYDYYAEKYRAFIEALDQEGANYFAQKQAKDTPITKIRRIFGRAEIRNDMQPFYAFVREKGQPRPMVEQLLTLGYVLSTLRNFCDDNDVVYRIAKRSAEDRAKIINERKEKLPQLQEVKGFANINLDPGRNVEKGLTLLLRNAIEALRDNKPAKHSQTYIGFELISTDNRHGFACGITRSAAGNTISISFIDKNGQTTNADFDVSYPIMTNREFEDTMKHCIRHISAPKPAKIQAGRTIA